MKRLALLLCIALTVVPLSPASAATFTVNTTDMSDDGSCDLVQCTLIEAIHAANANPGDDIIELTPDTYRVANIDNNIWGPTGLPAITSKVTLLGNGSILEPAPDAPDFRLLIVDASGNLTLDHLTIQGGSSSEGGGVFNFGLLQLMDVTLTDNQSLAPLGNLGGALGTVYGTTTVTNSRIAGNRANTGGAISNRAGTTILNNTYVEDNIASTYGGAIYGGTTVVLNGSYIQRNQAGNAGGGLFNDGGAFTISGGSISSNTADRGAGIFAQGSDVVLHMSSTGISSNIATGVGGGIFYAPYYGTGELTLEDSLVSENSATQGGGLHVQHGGTVTVSRTNFISNTASWGDGSAFHAISVEITTGAFSLNASCVVDNASTAVMNESPSPILDATDVWWGASDGPSGFGPGSGDSVSANVLYDPYLTVPRPGCPGGSYATPTPTSTDTPTEPATSTPTDTPTNTPTNTPTTTPTATPTTIPFAFSGFFQPVDNPPTLNIISAGRGIPVRFSLGGYQGLDIFAAGYPVSSPVSCGVTAEDGVEETVTVGSSSLSYDAAADQYIYTWKTERAWEGTCRTLILKLSDGTYHRANFRFK